MLTGLTVYLKFLACGTRTEETGAKQTETFVVLCRRTVSLSDTLLPTVEFTHTLTWTRIVVALTRAIFIR